MLPEQHRGNKFFHSLVDEIHGEEKSDTGSVENNKPLVRIQSVLNGPLADCKIELLRKLGLPLHSDTYQGGDLSKDFVLAIKIAQLQEEQLKKIEQDQSQEAEERHLKKDQGQELEKEDLERGRVLDQSLELGLNQEHESP